MTHLRAALAPLWRWHCRACESIPRAALPWLWALVAALGLFGAATAPLAPAGIACALIGAACAWQGWRQATGRTIDPSTLRLPWRNKRG